MHHWEEEEEEGAHVVHQSLRRLASSRCPSHRGHCSSANLHNWSGLLVIGRNMARRVSEHMYESQVSRNVVALSRKWNGSSLALVSYDSDDEGLFLHPKLPGSSSHSFASRRTDLT
jgi:hypothetical protein